MLEDLQIRPYLEKDKQGVVALWREAFPNSPPWNIPEDHIERKLKVQRELFFIAEVTGKIVGTAMAGYDGHRGWVYSVAVSQKYRKQGIGKALMERVERGLIDIGCPKLNLQVRASNNEVVEFYKRLGYGVEDRVSMGKLLPGDKRSN
ncbi:MAG: GNAT family acetyltransferase [Candidatus Zixiibacteriota bacterium]|nr:MAG: GNAT family acetyltransferase [candidate division Zixibacteria bacterium]